MTFKREIINNPVIDFSSKPSNEIMNNKFIFSKTELDPLTFKFNILNEMKNTNFTIQFLFTSKSKVTKFLISNKEHSFHEVDDTTIVDYKYLKQICDVNVDSQLNFIILSTIIKYN
jgi:hypothetical protein